MKRRMARATRFERLTRDYEKPNRRRGGGELWLARSSEIEWLTRRTGDRAARREGAWDRRWNLYSMTFGVGWLTLSGVAKAIDRRASFVRPRGILKVSGRI